ncbi:MAG TPA: hypothetical protein VMU84_09415 [Thermoanaerobaculia bacterium]|nr:hypothetical protein [Thermoanaerobaculia bacterium]
MKRAGFVAFVFAIAILHVQLAQAQTTIKHLQFPAGSVHLSTLNLPLTLDLPCYGRVLVTFSPNPPTGAQGGVVFFHQTSAENQSPQNNLSIVWGADTDRFSVLTGPATDFTLTFTFLDGPPDPSRLFLIVAGLATVTTATVSTVPATPPGTLAGEFASPAPPAALTSTTLISGSTLSNAGDHDLKNTGWALYKIQPAAAISSLSVAMHQAPGDGVGWTLAYTCSPAVSAPDPVPALSTAAQALLATLLATIALVVLGRYVRL